MQIAGTLSIMHLLSLPWSQPTLPPFPLLPLAAGLERMERLGFGAIRPSAGMAVITALLRGLGSGGDLPGPAAGSSRLPPSLLASVFYWDKFKSSSPLFSGLKQLQAGSPDQLAAAAAPGTIAGQAAAATSAGADAGLTADAIQLAVTAAVVAVLGSDVGADTPLVGAGLDSLGELQCWWQPGWFAVCRSTAHPLTINCLLTLP